MDNESITPAKPRVTQLLRDDETRRLLRDCGGHDWKVEYDRAAGAFKVWNQSDRLIMRGIQKEDGGSWIVTASRALD